MFSATSYLLRESSVGDGGIMSVPMPNFGDGSPVGGDDDIERPSPGVLPAMATVAVRKRPKNAKKIVTVYGSDLRPRQHGFEWPPDRKQIVAWVTIVIFFAAWFTLHGPFFPNHVAGVVCSCAFVGLGLATLTMKIYVTLSPNEDKCTHGPQLDKTVLYNDKNFPDGKYRCPYCCRFVIIGSRHCSVCDKCVGPHFDHHCGYLNTCITQRNYKPFAAFLAVTLLTATFQWAVTLYLVVELARGGERDEHFRRRLITLYGEKHACFAAYVTFLVLVWFYQTAAIAGLGHLSVFHVWLRVNGMTTMQYLDLKKKEKTARKDAAKSGSPAPKETPMCPCLEPTKRRDFKGEAEERSKVEDAARKAQQPTQQSPQRTTANADGKPPAKAPAAGTANDPYA